MRADYPSSLAAALKAQSRSPRLLSVWHFPTAGDVYISDAPWGAADGLSAEYLPLVEDWGSLVPAGGDPTAGDGSAIRQTTVTLWNGGDAPFSDHFLQDDPETVTVDIYQWADGVPESDRMLIGVFIVQDPIGYGEASGLVSLDLVDLTVRHDRPLGPLITRDDWPHARESDIGRSLGIVVGRPGETPTLCARQAPGATLDGSILADSLTIKVREDLDALGFPAAGELQIGEEKVRFSSRTANTFAVSQRGWQSEAAEHLDGDEVALLVDDHTYLVSVGPIAAIDEVKVAGAPAPQGIYTVHPDLDPARIVFSEKPYGVRYADSSSFLEMQFDAINPDNTAWQAHLAYDQDPATAARLSAAEPVLSLRQVTDNPDRGEIVRAYLAVEHWEDAPFANDYVEVSLGGQLLGRLSRPNADDQVSIDAEVDIDHGHTHSISGEHTHQFIDPVVTAGDSGHGHGLSGVATEQTYVPSGAIPRNVRVGSHGLNGKYEGVENFYFSGLPGSWVNSYVRARIVGYNYTDILVNGNVIRADGSVVTVGLGAGSGTGKYITVTVRSNVNWGAAEVLQLDLVLTLDGNVEVGYTGITVHASGGANQNATDKSADDVHDLATDNRPVQVTGRTSPTRTAVNLFDVTGLARFDWSWFTDRDLRLEYKGADDNRRVYVVHAWFDIEYRRRERVYSDDVTCSPTGIIDADGSITGTQGALLTAPQDVRHYLLVRRAGMDQTVIDQESFAAAAAEYQALGYRFDGVIDGDTTLLAAERDLARQCRSRFFFSGGRARIALRRGQAELTPVRSLTAADLRMRSISARRQAVADLDNTITLFYDRDQTAGEARASYRASHTRTDAASQAAHGVREHRDRWLFPLVRQADMAADLAGYYLEVRATPSTFYWLDTWIGNIDLEPGDVIEVTADFNRLRKARMIIRAVEQHFGQGKSGRINILRLVAECLRYLVHEAGADDLATVADALLVELGLDVHHADVVTVTAELVAAAGWTADETVAVADLLVMAAGFAPRMDETATAEDSIAASVAMTVTDQATVMEEFDIWKVYGFGAGGFGSVGFGGRTRVNDTFPHIARITDLVTSVVTAIIGGQALVSDSIAAGGGFGGPIGDGFGRQPFGR